MPLVLLALVMAEIGLLLAMNRAYYSVGVPLFRKRVPVHYVASSPPDPAALSGALSKSVFLPFLFKRLDGTEVGFREALGVRSLFKVSYPPLMHGLVVFDSASRQVVVTGYANLWMCALIVYVGKQFVVARDLGLTIFFLVFVAVCYGLQARRYGRVAKVAAEEWQGR